MLTATYSGAASAWTQAIDDALRAWSPFVVGDAQFQIEVTEKDLGTALATHRGIGGVSAGMLADGTPVFVPSSIAKMQGLDYQVFDFRITFNPNYQWAFGGAETGKYNAVSVAMHELGHGLGISTLSSFTKKPWQIDNHMDLADAFHLADPHALMYPYSYLGGAARITEADVRAVSAAGTPTSMDDTIYVVGPRVDGGAGYDTAVWLGTFDQFAAELVNIEALSLRGPDPLTVAQADLYRLYDASFNRTPDLAGFAYWAGSGLDSAAIASAFASSAEFTTLYAGDRPAIVTALYRNVLDRDPDAEGLAYWLGSDANSATMLVGFALAPENALGAIEFSV